MVRLSILLAGLGLRPVPKTPPAAAFFPASEGAVLRLVTVPEGATPLTRMSGASSLASWRIMPNAACFEATYSTPPPTQKDEVDRVKTIRPLGLLSSANAALAPSRQPLILTPNI